MRKEQLEPLKFRHDEQEQRVSGFVNDVQTLMNTYNEVVCSILRDDQSRSVH